MLSLGTEVFLAFWMASTRVGLPDRSAPPMRAATSMFLMSFAKALARRESVTAFWCFVVAHLECPDIHLPLSCSFVVRSLFVSAAQRCSVLRQPCGISD